MQAFLTRRGFKQGKDVKEGALLFTRERPPFEAAVDTAAAQIAQARPEVVRTRRDLERARKLYEQGNVSQQSLDRATGTIAVRAVFANPEKLLVPGLFVTVILQSTEPKPALLIPQPAVQEDQAGRFVLVLGAEKKAEVRRIETGPASAPPGR